VQSFVSPEILPLQRLAAVAIIGREFCHFGDGMRTLAGLLVFGALLASCGATQAQTAGAATAPDSSTATPATAAPGDTVSVVPRMGVSDTSKTMVCRTGTLIGSRLPGPKVCKTQWQWDEQRRIARKEIDYDQIRGYSSH
jgi:hypothetical protein